MIILLIAHNVYHFIYGEILIAEFCSAYVLSHVNRSAVAAYEKFFVKTVFCEVSPNTAVLFTEKQTFLQAFVHKFLAHEISITLVIYLVKAYAESLISFIKSGIDPFVHFSPKSADIFVSLLPFHEHFMSFFDERCFTFRFFFGFFLSHSFGNIFL